MGNLEGKNDRLEADSLTPFLAPLQALQDLLAVFNNQGVIIGGIAASLLGTPRYTVDLDAVFLLKFDDLPQLLQEAARRGIAPRISDPEGFARKNRILLLRHTSSGTDIDLSLGILPFEIEMVQRSKIVDAGMIQLRLPTPEDLIIMKAVAHRPKDLIDIQAIATSNPNLDQKRVQDWIEKFGEALDLPDLWDEIRRLL
jgi:predicted nucleotidyltransferase